MSDHYYATISTVRRTGFGEDDTKKIRAMIKDDLGFEDEWVTEVKSVSKKGNPVWGVLMFVVQDWELWDAGEYMAERLYEEMLELDLKESWFTVRGYDDHDKEVFNKRYERPRK